jgi:hypothetical protein
MRTLGLMAAFVLIAVLELQAQSLPAHRVAARTHDGYTTAPQQPIAAAQGCPAGNCGNAYGQGASLDAFPGRCCPDAPNACCTALWANYCNEKKPCWTPAPRTLPGGHLAHAGGCHALNHPCLIGHGCHKTAAPSCQSEGCAAPADNLTLHTHGSASSDLAPLQPPAIDMHSTPFAPDPAALPDIPKSDVPLDGQLESEPSADGSVQSLDRRPTAKSVGFPFLRRPTAQRSPGFPFSNR